MKVGDTVKGKLSGIAYTILKLLGQGGQGCVFLIENPAVGLRALKWYFEAQATPQQYAAIMNVIRLGPPDYEGRKEFIWPEDIIELDGGFGYVMEVIDTENLITYGDMISNPKLAPNLRTRCIISMNLVNAYSRLHIRGYCYRDISDGNLFFNPKTGEIKICDNDNVGVEGMSASQVLGTLEYMAPEVIKGECKPKTSTDLYSLAVLLFKLWVWHHPYHGTLEYNIKSWDLIAKKWLYGEHPIFIFDPVNQDNRLPDNGEYDSIATMWNILPGKLQDAFMTSFTVAVSEPSARLKEFQWEDIFREILDSIQYCPDDGAENFYEPDKPIKCWYCSNVLEQPIILTLESNLGRRDVVLTGASKLYGSHIDELGHQYGQRDVIGYVTKHPEQQERWGLYNNSNMNWRYEAPDCNHSTIPVGKNAPIVDGARIYFSDDILGTIRTSKGNTSNTGYGRCT